jgi:hypothetical protein
MQRVCPGLAAGLGATWLFRKARILAIFEDLDTVLLMIPLKILMVGLAWQMGLIVVVIPGPGCSCTPPSPWPCSPWR